jgi:hypothetical protein
MSHRMGDAYSNVPAGTRWCPHCNGYGSSLKEASGRCSRCGRTGRVAVADPEEQEQNGDEPAGSGTRGMADADRGGRAQVSIRAACLSAP